MFNDPAIAGSWPALVDRLDSSGRTAQWATQAPALTGLRTVDQLPALVAETVSPARADQVIGALVRLAAADGADDPDAVLVLIHLLSGGVHILAAKLAHLSDNIVTVVVGELTCQIRRYPWQRRTRAHAINLLLTPNKPCSAANSAPANPASPSSCSSIPRTRLSNTSTPPTRTTRTSTSSTCCSGPADMASHHCRTC